MGNNRTKYKEIPACRLEGRWLELAELLRTPGRPVEERISDMDTGREIEPHFTSQKVLKGIWALAQRKSHDSYFTLNIKAGVAHESPESIYTWITPIK